MRTKLEPVVIVEWLKLKECNELVDEVPNFSWFWSFNAPNLESLGWSWSENLSRFLLAMIIW
jgi:hypothetical protein